MPRGGFASSTSYGRTRVAGWERPEVLVVKGTPVLSLQIKQVFPFLFGESREIQACLSLWVTRGPVSVFPEAFSVFFSLVSGAWHVAGISLTISGKQGSGCYRGWMGGQTGWLGSLGSSGWPAGIPWTFPSFKLPGGRGVPALTPPPLTPRRSFSWSQPRRASNSRLPKLEKAKHWLFGANKASYSIVMG